MAYKLIESAQRHWRMVALVRAQISGVRTAIGL